MQEKLSPFSLDILQVLKGAMEKYAFKTFSWIYPANIYLLKVKNRNTRKRYEIYPN